MKKSRYKKLLMATRATVTTSSNVVSSFNTLHTFLVERLGRIEQHHDMFQKYISSATVLLVGSTLVDDGINKRVKKRLMGETSVMNEVCGRVVPIALSVPAVELRMQVDNPIADGAWLVIIGPREFEHVFVGTDSQGYVKGPVARLTGPIYPGHRISWTLKGNLDFDSRRR